MNVAVGLARLGNRSALLGRVGRDRAGFWLRDYLRGHQVKLIEGRSVEFTGVATSRRISGEPSYSFTSPVRRRRISFTSRALSEIAAAPAVVSNSFPLEDPTQTGLLYEALASCAGLRVIDPNPRPALLDDVAAFRAGFERVSSLASMVKISEDDSQALYRQPADEVAKRLIAGGVKVVVITKGPDGGAIMTTDGVRVASSAAAAPGPIIDTLGAGDAAVASLVSGIVRTGLQLGADAWQRHLDVAMGVAAATCRAWGGLLQLTVPANRDGAGPGGESRD